MNKITALALLLGVLLVTAFGCGSEKCIKTDPPELQVHYATKTAVIYFYPADDGDEWYLPGFSPIMQKCCIAIGNVTPSWDIAKTSFTCPTPAAVRHERVVWREASCSWIYDYYQSRDNPIAHTTYYDIKEFIYYWNPEYMRWEEGNITDKEYWSTVYLEILRNGTEFQ